MSIVEIGHKKVGDGWPVFVTAEIGINHNGDLGLAKALIRAAKNAGADAVKFQKRTVDVVYSPEELAAPRESPFGKTNGDLKRGLEFDAQAYWELAHLAKELDLIFYASPWDLESVDFLETLGVPCHKVASPVLTNKELLHKLRDTGKPLFVSTGMSTEKEVFQAIAELYRPEHNRVLMHCVSSYPTPYYDINLNYMMFLSKVVKEVYPVGYSGHEEGIFPSVLAAALGAVSIERHLTLSKTMWGSDHKVSLEPDEFKEMVLQIKRIHVIMGDSHKRLTEEENASKKKLRKVNTL